MTKAIFRLRNIDYFYCHKLQTSNLKLQTSNLKLQTSNQITMNIPSDLHYTTDHEWIKIIGNTALVGITDFAQGELGDIVFVEIETVGSHLEKGQTFGTIEAVKTVSDLFMPVSGKVLEVNSKINESPELINKDPYGEAWLIKVAVDDAAQISELMDATAYAGMINS